MRPTLLRHILLASGLALAGSPVLAQQPVPDARAGRTLTTTGQTKPPAGEAKAPAGQTKPKAGGGSPLKAANEAEMQKAQKAAAARDKAWDSKMRTTMGSICRGC